MVVLAPKLLTVVSTNMNPSVHTTPTAKSQRTFCTKTSNRRRKERRLLRKSMNGRKGRSPLQAVLPMSAEASPLFPGASVSSASLSSSGSSPSSTMFSSAQAALSCSGGRADPEPRPRLSSGPTFPSCFGFLPADLIRSFPFHSLYGHALLTGAYNSTII